MLLEDLMIGTMRPLRRSDPASIDLGVSIVLSRPRAKVKVLKERDDCWRERVETSHLSFLLSNPQQTSL